MNLLALNHDVLCSILSFADARSAMQFSMVSRTAYGVGTPFALSSVTLSRSQKQVSQFCRFMLADGYDRVHFLRELIIESAAFGVSHHIEFQRIVDFSAVSELADLIERAHRLRRLSIACFEDLIAKQPRIAHALPMLSDLTEISIHNSAQLSLDVLQSMRSDLRRLAFTQLFNRKLPAFFHRLVKMTRLETLELAHLDLEGMAVDGGEPFPDIRSVPQIPSLRALTVRGTTARMDLFVHAFPNIQSLQISGVYAKIDRFAEPPKEPGSAWARLDHLRGNVPDFRYWNAVCPVRRLDLDLTAYHYVDTVDIVRRSSPLVLSLPVETKTDGGFWRPLVAAGSKVRYLELCLDEGRVSKLHWWMDNMLQILGTLPLVALFICYRQPHAAGSETDSKDQPPCDAVIQTFREHIARQIPSLCYLALGVAPKGVNPLEHAYEVPFWYRIEGGRQLEALPYGTGQNMRQRFRDSTWL